MKIVTLLACLALLQPPLFAQTGKTISGQVKDIQNETVAGATIRLYKATDTTQVLHLITKDNGKFTFNNLAGAGYILTITSVGSKVYTSSLLTVDDSHTAILLPAIILQPAKQTDLKEVVVTAKKPLIEQDIDKTIVNVDAMLTAAGGNALDVLEKTPGITISANGDIDLNGKQGVLVLIEGRSTYMSGNDLAAYLKSIPAGTLDKIELMSNPPARYDAQGGAVINIRFKKNRVQGYTGSVSLNFSQGITNHSYNSLNFNYLDKKVNLFANINVNKDRGFDDDHYYRTFYNTAGQQVSATSQANYYTYNLHDFTGRAGMDYTASSKTIIGFIASIYNRHKNEGADFENSLVNYEQSGADSTGSGNMHGNSAWRQVTANINMQHKFNNKGRELSAEVNYINYNNTAGQLYNNSIKPDNGATDSNYIFSYNLPYQLNVYNAKADYTHPLPGKAVLSAGIKSSLVNNSNQSDYYGGSHIADLSKSNHFSYTENINALYVNARKEWQRFSAQLGLRIENTSTTGHLLGNTSIADNSNTRHYTGFFPSTFLLYKLDSVGNNTLSANFSRRVIRPNYQQLNPFQTFIDQYSYSTGNPYLNPGFGNSFELNYRYKQIVSISLQYENYTNAFFNATQPVGTAFISMPVNAGSRSMLGLITNLNFSVTKWWRANVNLGTANFVTRGSVFKQTLNQSIYAGRINTLSQFTIAKNWNAEFVTRYTSPIINLQRRFNARYSINAAIQKKIAGGKGSIKLNVDDILWSQKQTERFTGLYLADARQTFIQDSRRVSLSFNYNFGKEIFARKRRYNDNGIDDVKGRVD